MIRWELHRPPGIERPGWMDEISELRGRVLYEGGRRPEFRRSDGQFADRDPLDPHAFHITARSCDQLVGCVRLFRPIEGRTCLTERLVGAERFEAMLRTLGSRRDEAVEASRWVVDPDHRSRSLGSQLATGAIAAARAFGFGLLFCSAGTRGRQDLMLTRLGLLPFGNMPLFPDVKFDDELRVMYVFPDRSPPGMCDSMGLMAAELGLDPPGGMGCGTPQPGSCLLGSTRG